MEISDDDYEGTPLVEKKNEVHYAKECQVH